MKSQPLVSIILPVCNGEPHLRQCLDSVLVQTYENLEILCVSGGSADGSMDILQEYEERDARVRVLCKPQAGVAALRNAALDAATGEWVAVMHPASWLVPHACETALQVIREGVDLVCFGTRVVQEKEQDQCVAEDKRGWTVPFTGIRKKSDEVLLKLNCQVWDKLYRRSVISASTARFETDDEEGEDLCFNAIFNVHVKEVAFIDERLLCLRPRKENSRLEGGELRCKEHLVCMERLLGYYQEHGREGRFSSYLAHLLCLIYTAMIRDSAVTDSQKKWLDAFEALAEARLQRGCPELTAAWSRLLPQIGRMRHAEQLVKTASVEGLMLEDAIHVAVVAENETRLHALVATMESLRHLPAWRRVCVHVVSGMAPQSLSRLRQFDSPEFAVRLYGLDSALLNSLPFHETRMSCRDLLCAIVPLLLRDVDRAVLLPAGSVVSAGFETLWPKEGGASAATVLSVEGVRNSSSDVIFLELRKMRESGRGDAWLSSLLLDHPERTPNSTDSLRAAFPESVRDFSHGGEGKIYLAASLLELGSNELSRLSLALSSEGLRQDSRRCLMMYKLSWGRRKHLYFQRIHEFNDQRNAVDEMERVVELAHCSPHVTPWVYGLSPSPEPPDGLVKTIAFVNASPFEPQRGGIQRVTDELCKHLCKTYRVLYFCLWVPSGTYRFPVPLFLPGGQSPHEKLLSYHTFLREQKVDVVINQGGQFATSYFFLDTGDCNVRKISVLHSTPMREYSQLRRLIVEAKKSSWKTCLAGRILKFFLKRAQMKTRWTQHYRYVCDHTDALCLLSPRHREELAEVAPELARTAVAIPNPNTYDPAPAIEWRLKEREVIFVGRLDNRVKQVSLLLDIWRLVQEKHPEWKLSIVGDGIDRKRLEAQAAGLSRCRFVGRQDSEPYYRRASILCMTSLFEGWGMVLTEAQQFGVVPIAFDSYAAVRDIIEPGVSGELAPPFSIGEYAHKLSRLMEDGNYRNRLARQAVESVRRFSNKKVVEQWRKLIDAL